MQALSSRSPYERRLWTAALLLLAIGVLGHLIYPLTPAVVRALVQGLGLHANLGSNHFVDVRAWAGIPNAADVLSNMPFALFGFWGLVLQAITGNHLNKISHRYLGREGFVLTVFFVGLIFTAIGSMLYHLAPNDESLLLDRMGMAFAFAGMLGVAASERVSARSGIWLGLSCLLAGALSLLLWVLTTDVLPWVVLQFGSMALIVVLAITRQHTKSLGVSLYAVVACYVIAKICEANDHAIYEASSHAISGHTLKHLVASLSSLPVIISLRKAAYV